MGKKKSKKKNKKDANKLEKQLVEKKLDSSILDNRGIRALITALAVAVVEQLLQAIATQGDGSQDQGKKLSKLGDAIKEAAASLQGMADGKSNVTETVATVKDAIAEIKPVVAGVVPVVQSVVSALKDKAEEGKAVVQGAQDLDLDAIQDTVQTIHPTSPS